MIAAGTRRLLGGLFAYRDLGPVELKGFAGPVAAYQILGEAGAEGRFEALHGGAGLTPLVGRVPELDRLLERWGVARDGGGGQVVLLSGEAGIGKSRLLRALRERLEAAEPEHTPLPLFCSPHHANTAFHPVVGLLERAAGLRRDDPPAASLDKLEAMLARGTAGDDDPRPDAAALADLLAIPVPDGRYPPPPDPSAQQRREAVFRALLGQLAGLAARRPVLALYEDVHWADPSTLELIGRTIGRVRGLPVLVVVTFRPEFVAPWAGEQPHVTALPLGRLGRRQGGTMVGRVAGGKPLPPEVLERILARTDGVPLFVEELTRSVLESGLLRDEGDRWALDGPLPPFAIPTTLQDSLMARLDRLAPVKEVAQVAAVIGREFRQGLLAAVVARGGDELCHALDRLVAAGLVLRRGEGATCDAAEPSATYAFKHALVRDAAYQSLLRGRRKQLHARVAQVLEDRFPETAAAEPELLARHCARAGLPERAARHWLRAAQLAVARSANLEAIAHCGDAEVQLRALPASPARSRTELDVQLLRGIAVRAGKGYAVPEAEQAFTRACELCEELGDRVRLVHALRGVFGFYYIAGRWEDAARVAGRIDAAAQGLDDPTALMLRWFIDGASTLFRGRPVEAAPRLEEALRQHDRGGRETHLRQLGVDMGALVRTHLALAHWLTGRTGLAAAAADEVLAAARAGANPFSMAQMLANVALLRLLAGEWAEVETLAAETREVASRHGMADYVSFGGMLAGVATAALGDPPRGVGLAREALAGLRRGGWGCVVPVLLASLAESLAGAGEGRAAVETAEEALAAGRAGGELCWEPEVLRVLGGARLAAGAAASEAEADLEAALALARRQGALAFELRAATTLARLWAEGGERDRARGLLAPVHGRFAEGFGTRDVWEAGALLAALG